VWDKSGTGEFRGHHTTRSAGVLGSEFRVRRLRRGWRVMGDRVSGSALPPAGWQTEMQLWSCEDKYGVSKSALGRK
jgi:hypothetical protein